jgi:hypothetical protein
MYEDDNLSIILGRPFLNTAGVSINCTKSKVTFSVKGKEQTIHFLKNSQESIKHSVNTLSVMNLNLGSFKITIPPDPTYELLMSTSIPVKVEAT